MSEDPFFYGLAILTLVAVFVYLTTRGKNRSSGED